MIGGVSGCGKSTIGSLVARRLSYRFVDADDLHPAANVAKMSRGEPLQDADRLPWLDRVAEVVGEDPRTVVACSALRRMYRDRLRQRAPSTLVVLLVGPAELLQERLTARRGHFMPPTLLTSQLDSLEPLGEGEVGFEVGVDAHPAALADEIVRRIAIHHRVSC